MSKEIEYYEYLATIMHKTRGCRFGAASALASKERWSVGTVTFLSAYLLSWSIILLCYPEFFTPKHVAFYTAISAIASISLLVVSLMDFAFGRSVQADKLHQNALNITSCMRDLERELARSAPNVTVLEKIAINYERHNAETQINHTEKDFTRWQYNSAKATGFLTRLWYPVRRFLYNIWFYVSSMFMYPLLLTAIIVPTIWYTVRFVIP